jgi:hypothetical protein
MAPLEPRLAALVRLVTKRHFLSYQYPVLVCPSKMSYYLSRMDNGYTPQTETKNPCCTLYIYVHTFLFTVQAGMSVASFSIHFSKYATPFTVKPKVPNG